MGHSPPFSISFSFDPDDLHIEADSKIQETGWTLVCSRCRRSSPNCSPSLRCRSYRRSSDQFVVDCSQTMIYIYIYIYRLDTDTYVYTNIISLYIYSGAYICIYIYIQVCANIYTHAGINAFSTIPSLDGLSLDQRLWAKFSNLHEIHADYVYSYTKCIMDICVCM